MTVYKKSIAILLCSAALLILPGCNDKLASTKEELAPIMTIDNMEVPFELYRYVSLNYRDEYEAGLSDADAAALWLGDEGAARLTELENATLSTLKHLYATVTLAAEYGFTVDDPIISDSVEMRMDEVYAGYENDMDIYMADLQAHHMNDSVYRFLMLNDALTDELFYAMLNKGEILSDADELRSLIESDSFIRVKQILIPSDNGNTAEENKTTAENIHAKLKNGEDFEDLMNQYGQDLYMFNNPDGYYITRGSRYQAFEDAAFSLKVGQYSDVVETEAGYSILKRYEKEESYLDKHFDALCQEYFDAAYNLLLEAHEATLTVEKLPLYENYTIFTMDQQP